MDYRQIMDQLVQRKKGNGLRIGALGPSVSKRSEITQLLLEELATEMETQYGTTRTQGLKDAEARYEKKDKLHRITKILLEIDPIADMDGKLGFKLQTLVTQLDGPNVSLNDLIKYAIRQLL